MAFKIFNRRYTGSKNKLVPWIADIIKRECADSKSFFDIFAGTGVVTYGLLNLFNELHINDFLYSNEIIYDAFFGNRNYDFDKIIKIARKYKTLLPEELTPDYVTKNFGGKYFSIDDALKIDFIRNDIEYRKKYLNKQEYNILLASLIYSFDRSANTVGHYDAFIKSENIKNSFKYELISPALNKENNQIVNIYREDANILASKVVADVVYVDPPYSSRQYSRFYHVIETIAKWDKPELHGTALKPEPENISDYCKVKAVDVFNELIIDLKAKYIVVSYNNTYNSKSKSSKNKMTLEQITDILERKGTTKLFTIDHKAFNAGKTDFENHQEVLFVTKVGDKK